MGLERPMSVREAMDPSRPLPPAVMDTLAWLDSKDAYIAKLEDVIQRAFTSLEGDTEWSLERWYEVIGETLAILREGGAS